MTSDLQGKRALVTGGASGLGAATCRALAAAGARVMVVDLNGDGAQDVAQEVGGIAHSANVADLETNRAMVAAAMEQLGGLDLLYLNAGVASGCGLGGDFDLELYRRAMGVNLDGVVFGTQAALEAWEGSAPEAAIVATASLAGLTAVPFDPIYAANKHAVVGLARSLGLSLRERGVRFNAVCPGFAESRIIDPIREGLEQAGIPVIPAELVAETVLTLFRGEMSGECWFVQAGREPAAFNFRGIPGPRTEEGARGGTPGGLRAAGEGGT